MKYQPKLHTPASLEAQLTELNNANPDIRIVGSLGRAVIFNSYLKDPNFEFALRDQDPLHKYGEARDIDSINCVEPLEDEEFPFRVDVAAFNNTHATIEREDGIWYLSSQTRDFVRQLHPAVMERVDGGTIFGIQIPTVPLATHIALNGVRGALRAKDKPVQAALQRLQDNQSVDPSCYEPFEELASIKPKGVATYLQRVVSLVPESVISKLPRSKLPHLHL